MRDQDHISIRLILAGLAGSIVADVIDHANHPTVGRGQHRLAEAVELFVRGCVAFKRTPVLQQNKIHGKLPVLAHLIGVVKDAVSALIHQPLAGEGQLQPGGVLVAGIMAFGGRRQRPDRETIGAAILVDHDHSRHLDLGVCELRQPRVNRSSFQQEGRDILRHHFCLRAQFCFQLLEGGCEFPPVLGILSAFRRIRGPDRARFAGFEHVKEVPGTLLGRWAHNRVSGIAAGCLCRSRPLRLRCR